MLSRRCLHCRPLLILSAILGFATLLPLTGQSAFEPLKADGAAPAKLELPEGFLKSLAWRSIGPANMSGRITAVAVCEADPSTWWAATASGGLLKTTNNGITFEHQFDRETVVSLGDVAVAPSSKDVLWVGTGE